MAAGLALWLLVPHTQTQMALKGNQHPAANVAMTPWVSSSADHVVRETTGSARQPHEHTFIVAAGSSARHTQAAMSRPDMKMVATVAVGRVAVGVRAAAPRHIPDVRTVAYDSESTRLISQSEPPRAQNAEHISVDEPERHFSLLPMMDKANQRATVIAASDNGAADSLGANIDANRDDTLVGSDKSSNADGRSDTSTEDAPRQNIRVVRLSQMPPDARHYLSTADIKRELDARNFGYSRTTMEGIKRQEATFALIGGKF